MQLSPLAQKLNTPLYTALTAAEQLTQLNTPGAPGSVAVQSLLVWAGQNNIMPALRDAAAATGALQGVADAALQNISLGLPFNLADPNVVGMFNALVSGGVITAAAQTALIALVSAPSDAMSTLGRAATSSDVTTAQAQITKNTTLNTMLGQILASNSALLTLANGWGNDTTGTVSQPTTSQLQSTASGVF